MKNLLFISLTLISQALLGQNHKNITDTIAVLFPESIDSLDVSVKSDTDYQIITARRYFPNSKIINKEFFRIDKKTYRYWENDSLNNNRLISNGNLIGNPEVIIEGESDTIQPIDPITYDVWSVFLNYFKLEKQGRWFESDSIFTFKGNYKSNKREDKWIKTKWNDGYDIMELVYKSGSLVSETQLNLIKKADFNTIKKALTNFTFSGKSTIGYTSKNTTQYFFERGSSYPMFNSNGIYDRKDCYCDLSPTRRQYYTWTIDDKLVIEINKCGVKERFQLLSIFEDGIDLESLDK